MFRNGRIIAKFCVFTELCERLSRDSCNGMSASRLNSKSVLLRAGSSVIKCFNICQRRRGGGIEGKPAEIRPCRRDFETQVKRNVRNVRRKDRLGFLVGGIFRIGGNGSECLLAGSVKCGILITRYICAHPVVRIIGNL